MKNNQKHKGGSHAEREAESGELLLEEKSADVTRHLPKSPETRRVVGNKFFLRASRKKYPCQNLGCRLLPPTLQKNQFLLF